MYLYDVNGVRYQLAQTNGGKPYNWLLIPGGPGVDSTYFTTLIEKIDLPGNVWLIDLPGNGSNVGETLPNFDKWLEIFPEVIKRFENPVLVGHSFGGMLPLLFPEFEKCLKGFVILSSAPKLWLEEAVAYSKQFNLPDLSKEMQEFTVNPSQKTFEAALGACAPYYFPPSKLEEGRKFITRFPVQYQAAVWWQRKAIEIDLNAKWVPEKVPTLIVNAIYDCMCPYTLFQNDKRFQRDNIKLVVMEDAGHFPWLDKPDSLQKAFNDLIVKLKDR